MIKITKEFRFWATPGQVQELFRSSTNQGEYVPAGQIGCDYDPTSFSKRSLTVFLGAQAPKQILVPKQRYTAAYLITAPTEDVQGFSLTSVTGTKVVGGREDPGMDFQVCISWEVVYFREDRWYFLKQPVYLKHLGVEVEYPKHERQAIRSILGYDPFK